MKQSTNATMFCGSDILSASLLYYVAKYDTLQQGKQMECMLSVCRPTAMKTISPIKNQFSKVGAIVDISQTGGVETIIPTRIKEEVRKAKHMLIDRFYYFHG